MLALLTCPGVKGDDDAVGNDDDDRDDLAKFDRLKARTNVHDDESDGSVSQDTGTGGK